LVGDNQLARPDPPHPGVPSRLSRLSRRSRLTTLFWLRVRRLSAGDDAPLSSLLMASWMDASKAAAKAAKDTDAAKEKEKLESVGRLKERSAKIPRAAGGLRKLLDKYLDETMSKTDKQKGVPAELQQMLAKMESVTLDFYGRKADSEKGITAIEPKLVKTFNLNSSEVKKLASAADKVQLYADKGKRMLELAAQLHGETGMLKLTKLPEVGKGGRIGELVTLHAESEC
jgi:hypothetical protein